MKRFRYWLSRKLAHLTMVVHPDAKAYREKWPPIYHIGPGRQCPGDPEWL